MNTFAFEGIGTGWSISLDGGTFSAAAKAAVLAYVDEFDQRFSRFKAGSEASILRGAKAGTYRISEEWARLLAQAAELRALTGGQYDPAIGTLLEQTGYGPDYRLVPDQPAIDAFVLPRWKLKDQELTVNGPVVFDIGGFGKGYLIDRVCEILQSFNYSFFLVDGGGDMYGSAKADGTPWRAAIEWPGKPDMAAGVVELKEGALAVSDSFRRRWENWHHVIDPQKKKPQSLVLGCAALAPSAFAADAMTSGLFLAPPAAYPALAERYAAEYLVFLEGGSVLISDNWPGELF